MLELTDKKLRLATLNLCLGLKNKKRFSEEHFIARKNQCSIILETEIESLFNRNVLQIPGFNLELETNTRLSRTVFYIADSINYTRKLTLEGIDSNLIIIDVKDSNPIRIINVYRSFNHQNGQSQREKFKYQLSLIKEAFNKRTVLLGDFNLHYFMKNKRKCKYCLLESENFIHALCKPCIINV